MEKFTGSAKFIKDNNIGIVCDDTFNIKSKKRELDDYRANVIEVREKYLMENQIDKVVEFLQYLMEVKNG